MLLATSTLSSLFRNGIVTQCYNLCFTWTLGANVMNTFLSSVTTYAEVKHSYWLLQDTWQFLTNQSALLKRRYAISTPGKLQIANI